MGLWKPTSQIGSVETYVPNGFRGHLRPKWVPWEPTSQMGSVETYVPNDCVETYAVPNVFRENLRPKQEPVLF